MKLTKKQYDQLWGEHGPYSEANIIIQTRILDDRVSLVFIEVEASINPLTFEIVKQNEDHFKDNPIIQQLIDHAEYRGQKFGYVVNAFRQQYTDEDVMGQAQAHLELTKEVIIEMHEFVMDLLDIKNIRHETA